MRPKKISIAEKKYLQILWDDRGESKILLLDLRKNCPCAICVTDRQKRPANYIPLLSEVQLTIKDIKVVGSYALQLIWKDGHYEGIYSYEFLKELGEKE